MGWRDSCTKFRNPIEKNRSLSGNLLVVISYCRSGGDDSFLILLELDAVRFEISELSRGMLAILLILAK